MRERPILFSAPMVRAILEGRKTQTRRLVKLPIGAAQPLRAFVDPGLGAGPYLKVAVETGEDDDIVERVRCPYGAPGDRLWVRETWAAVDQVADGIEREDPLCVGYRADLTARKCYGGDGADDFKLNTFAWNWEHPSIRWRPSIFMPRWASRITLEVTGVRVERLQDISEEDAIAEGISGPHRVPHVAYRIPDDSKPRYSTAAAAFEALWDSINHARAPWASNPWVWVVEFRRAEAAARAA